MVMAFPVVGAEGVTISRESPELDFLLVMVTVVMPSASGWTEMVPLSTFSVSAFSVAYFALVMPSPLRCRPSSSRSAWRVVVPVVSSAQLCYGQLSFTSFLVMSRLTSVGASAVTSTVRSASL